MGGGWDLASHAWDRIEGLESLRMTLAWLQEVRRLVKPTGSLWIHGTYHNAGIANVACQMLGLEIINEVVWYKRNAFPNLSARRLTASHETILWVHTGGAKDRRYRFNYEDVKAADYPSDQLKKPGKQLRTVWDIPNNKASDELAQGKHPTQKPLRIVERILAVAGLPGGELLVPFAGSGSEMVGGLRHGMRPTGFEVDAGYHSLATRRLEAELDKRELGRHPPNLGVARLRRVMVLRSRPRQRNACELRVDSHKLRRGEQRLERRRRSLEGVASDVPAVLHG